MLHIAEMNFFAFPLIRYENQIAGTRNVLECTPLSQIYPISFILLSLIQKGLTLPGRGREWHFHHASS